MFDWLINPIVKGIAGVLGDIFLNLIYQIIWGIFIEGPLLLISVFSTTLNYLSQNLVSALIFNGKDNNFSLSNVTTYFWIFLIIAGALFGILFGIQICIVYFSESTELKGKIITCLGNSAKSICFMFLIPIAFFLINYIISRILNGILAGITNKNSLADMLYYIGDPHYDQYINSPAPKGFPPPSDINEYNIVLELIAVYFVLYVMVLSELSLFQQAAELFFLFIISPIIMTTLILDNGKKAFVWKDLTLTRMFASSIILLGFNVFMFYLNVIESLVINLKNSLSGIEISLLQLCLVIGGVMAFKEFPTLISSLFQTSHTLDGGRQFMGQAKSILGKGAQVAKGLTYDPARLGMMVGKKIAGKLSKRNGDDDENENFAPVIKNFSPKRDNESNSSRGNNDDINNDAPVRSNNDAPNIANNDAPVRENNEIEGEE